MFSWALAFMGSVFPRFRVSLYEQPVYLMYTSSQLSLPHDFLKSYPLELAHVITSPLGAEVVLALCFMSLVSTVPSHIACHTHSR